MSPRRLAAAAALVALGWWVRWMSQELEYRAEIIRALTDAQDHENYQRVFDKLAAYIAWQERKLDQLGYDPATDPEAADPASLPDEVEAFLAEEAGGA